MKTLPIFWDWTHKNIPDRQHSARFRKSLKKSAISLHPNRHGLQLPYRQTTIVYISILLYVHYWLIIKILVWPFSIKKNKRGWDYATVRFAAQSVPGAQVTFRIIFFKQLYASEQALSIGIFCLQ